MRYTKSSCHICGRQVSRNGLAIWNHGMAHVRRGQARREVTAEGIRFRRIPYWIQMTIDDYLASLVQSEFQPVS